MKIYVLRHGETDENITSILQGNMDTILNEKGKNQAREVAKIVKDKNIDLIISSPKKRAVQTAILALPNVPIITDDRLKSRDHGEFEGKTRDEIDLKEYWNIKLNKQYKKAESIGTLFNRVVSLLEDIIIKYPNKNILLVTHSGICRVLYYYFNGFKEDGDLTEYESHNCSFEEYDLEI